MDLSINQVKNSQKINKQQSFKGVKGEFSENNIPVFKFNPPPYDAKTERASIEIVPLDYDEFANVLIRPFSQDVSPKDFNEEKPLKMPQEMLEGYKGFAYRYKITNLKNKDKVRYVTDGFEKIRTSDTNEEFSVIKIWDKVKIDPKKGAMRHSFLDADAILDMNGNLDLTDAHKSRNHFNKLGGSTKGLIELLKSGELDPYRYIISTPDIGNDPTSSHGYWPNNLYQTKDMQAFKDLNFELFKKGKGYVADGAFTSQSLQSPLFQHVLKWGKKSPYYSMFKLDGATRINLGILPNDIIENDDNNPVYNHIGIRIVNNPASNNYDPNKPIYLQFYDDRLSSEEQRNDTTKIIEAYDSQSEDIFEITHNDDSVYPFYFEIDTLVNPELKSKLEIFKDKNAVLLKEIDEQKNGGLTKFLDFGNFTISPDRHRASSATFWDGNRDIVKLNLSNPSAYTDGIYNDKNIEGMRNARNYLYGVARFHTEGIQADILKRTAMLSQRQREKIALQNDIENFSEILASQQEADYPILQQKKGVEDYLAEFPLQSLETSPELSAIFAENNFNKELLKTPEVHSILTDYITTIYDAVTDKLPEEKIEPVKEYRIYLEKAYTNEILRYLYSAALNPSSVDENGDVSIQELGKVTLKSLAQGAKNPDEERAMVIDKIAANISNVDIVPLVNKIKTEMYGVSLKDFKDTETLMLQSSAGLNWRFDAAKDIGDLDSVRAGSKNFKDIWDSPEGVVAFWSNFIQEVKKYNPSSYTIAELTNLWGIYHANDDKTVFDNNGINPDEKENLFLLQLNATTNSNYGQYFNKLSCFLGTNPETGYDANDNNPIYRAGNLYMLKDTVERFISNSQPQSAILTHEFFDNHDKPRLMHCLPLNMQLFLCGMDNKADNLYAYISKLPESKKEDFKQKVTDLTGRYDYTEINPMALSVGFAMSDTIDKTDYSPEDKQKLKNALRQLVNGQKSENSLPNYKRAKAFGTMPYEVTMRELFKRAGMDDDIDEKVKDLHVLMLKPSMDYLERLWQVMNTIVGTPTLFNGTEFAQTGYETSSKNEYVANRNQVLHGLKNDPRYKETYDKMFADSSLYLQPQMSAIREGFPVLCNITPNDRKFNTRGIVAEGDLDYYSKLILMNGGMEVVDKLFEDGQAPDGATLKKAIGIYADANNMQNFIKSYRSGLLQKYMDYKKESLKQIRFLPIFKYDDKGSKVLSIVTNNGVPRGEFTYEANNENLFDKNLKVKEIEISQGNKGRVLPEGLKFKKKVYKDGKYETEKNPQGEDIIYIISNNKLKRLDGKEIELEDTVVNFFVDKVMLRSPSNAIIQ